MGDFRERFAELRELVGSGELEGKVVYDQVYAAANHEHVDWNHPVGKDHYLSDPLLADHPGYYERIAARVLDEGPDGAMADNVDDLIDESARQAPKDLSILARSGAGTVTSDGHDVWARPAEVPRLTEDELYLLHHGKPDLHGAGRHGPREVGGPIVGHPGRLANPQGPR